MGTQYTIYVYIYTIENNKISIKTKTAPMKNFEKLPAIKNRAHYGSVLVMMGAWWCSDGSVYFCR